VPSAWTVPFFCAVPSWPGGPWSGAASCGDNVVCRRPAAFCGRLPATGWQKPGGAGEGSSGGCEFFVTKRHPSFSHAEHKRLLSKQIVVGLGKLFFPQFNINA